MTRDDIRNTASTLAYYWCSGIARDHEGVRRIILSHAADVRPALCAHILRFVEQRGGDWGFFDRLMFDLAGIEEEEEAEAYAALADLEQSRDAR